MAIQAASVDDLPPRTALHELTHMLQADLDKVNALILERSQSSVPLIADVAKHLIVAGGKRVRPLLTLACARLFGPCTQDHIKLATAVEFIHTATLLHDDVVDASDLRRGKETANTLWGNEASVLVGDFLFSQAFKLMVETQSLEALHVLSSTSAVIAQGEVKQLLSAREVETSAQTYFEIIDAKTAALFKAACEVSPLISDQSPDTCQALATYGQHLGLIFQITDDLLDYFGSAKEMGKSTGDDFREGKMTLPLVYAYAEASPDEKTFLKACFEAPGQNDQHFPAVQEIMKEKEIYTQCLHKGEEHGRKAKLALADLPKGDITLLLDGLVDYCLGRVN